MKNKQSVIFKWLALMVCLLAAGVFYSCSSRDTGQKAAAVQENRAFQAQSVPDMTGNQTEKVSLEKRNNLLRLKKI